MSIVAGDVCLVASFLFGSSGLPSAMVIAVTAAASLVVLAAGSWLLYVLPGACVFRCRPAAFATGAVLLGAAGTWAWMVSIDPLGAVLVFDRTRVAVGLAAFVVAAATTTLSLAAGVDAWNSWREERRWDEHL